MSKSLGPFDARRPDHDCPNLQRADKRVRLARQRLAEAEALLAYVNDMVGQISAEIPEIGGPDDCAPHLANVDMWASLALGALDKYLAEKGGTSVV